MEINFKFINPEIEETETEYGEPQGWLYLNNGRSIEIVHEEYCIPEEKRYFSIRLHCSEEEFDADVYHDTMGVIDTYCFDTLQKVKMIVEKLKEREGN